MRKNIKSNVVGFELETYARQESAALRQRYEIDVIERQVTVAQINRNQRLKHTRQAELRRMFGCFCLGTLFGILCSTAVYYAFKKPTVQEMPAVASVLKPSDTATPSVPVSVLPSVVLAPLGRVSNDAAAVNGVPLNTNVNTNINSSLNTGLNTKPTGVANNDANFLRPVDRPQRFALADSVAKVSSPNRTALEKSNEPISVPVPVSVPSESFAIVAIVSKDSVLIKKNSDLNATTVKVGQMINKTERLTNVFPDTKTVVTTTKTITLDY
jgi:hypothetical protein